MKKYKKLLDVVLLLGLLALTLVNIAPKSVVMPSTAQMVLTTVVLILLAAFVAFLWREKPADERELQNQADASRYAYMVGCITLIVALIVQTNQHTIDVIVPIALFLMVSTKVLVQRLKDD